jgi:FKBP-type peptidyl-prolyl cis-trans isomerase
MNISLYPLIIILSIALISCSNEKPQSEYPAAQEVIPVKQTEKLPEPVIKKYGYDVAGLDTFMIQDGLQIIKIANGNGPVARNGKEIAVHYTGYLENGTKFDSSVDHGKPYAFILGTEAVIKGWDLALAGLNTGSRSRIIIPPAFGYGAGGYPPLIPPNATLIFDVEIVSAK